MARAVLEGVALNAGWLIPHVTALAGSADRSISFGGGGAASPLWGQLLADVLGADVRRLANPHVTNAHGAALLALVEAGALSWHDADAALSVAEVHHPDPTVAGTYRRLLDAFVDAHDRWGPTFRILNSRSTPQEASSLMSDQKPGGHPGRPNATLHPYAGRFPVNRTMPEHGVARAEILDIVAQMQKEEDAKADNGRVSGSIYSGDHEHYAFLTEAFGHFAHANVMQRDMYPSATKMEAEIIAMTARHAPRRRRHRRAEHVRRHREPGHRDARLPRVGPQREGHRAPADHHAGHRPPGDEQGVPLVRHRAGASPRSPTTSPSTSTSCATTSPTAPSR